MNYTGGDLIILEIALQHYLKGIDLSTHAGQYMTSLLGKLENHLQQLSEAGIKDTALVQK